MARIFVVSRTLKDARGILGLLHVLLQDRIDAEDAGITFVQPISGDGAGSIDLFQEECGLFRRTAPGMEPRQVTYCPVHVADGPDGGLKCAKGILDIIRKHRAPACVLLDLGTACEDEVSTALYRAMRGAGLGGRCVLFAPYPESMPCLDWKERNGCTDFIVRREDVARARAVHVPMAARLCDALGVGPYAPA